uniref:Putative secreted protein n=1 Tax=Anopheles marajoara TaxID=58244 RepID=A0A2M4C9Z5_9DIPT
MRPRLTATAAAVAVAGCGGHGMCDIIHAARSDFRGDERCVSAPLAAQLPLACVSLSVSGHASTQPMARKARCVTLKRETETLCWVWWV